MGEILTPTFLLILLFSTVRLATPLIFAALGGMFSERAGVINIALEGLMLAGAFTAAVVTYELSNPYLGFYNGASYNMPSMQQFSSRLLWSMLSGEDAYLPKGWDVGIRSEIMKAEHNRDEPILNYIIRVEKKNLLLRGTSQHFNEEGLRAVQLISDRVKAARLAGGVDAIVG